MSEPLALTVLISGGGTNLQALIDACAAPDFPAVISHVISNNPDVKGLERAKNAGIRTSVINHRDYADRTSFEKALQNCIETVEPDLICLAGFMRLLTAEFVNSWYGRLINIHPSLLPAFKGLDTYQRAIDSGARFSGCTLHYVTPEMDDGPIIMQAAVEISDDETPDSLAAKILVQEHVIYPAAVKLIAEKKLSIDGKRVKTSASMDMNQIMISPKPNF